MGRAVRRVVVGGSVHDLPLDSRSNQTLQNVGSVLGVAVVVTVHGDVVVGDRGRLPAVWLASAAIAVVAAAIGSRASVPQRP